MSTIQTVVEVIEAILTKLAKIGFGILTVALLAGISFILYDIATTKTITIKTAVVSDAIKDDISPDFISVFSRTTIQNIYKSANSEIEEKTTTSLSPDRRGQHVAIRSGSDVDIPDIKIPEVGLSLSSVRDAITYLYPAIDTSIFISATSTRNIKNGAHLFRTCASRSSLDRDQLSDVYINISVSNSLDAFTVTGTECALFNRYGHIEKSISTLLADGLEDVVAREDPTVGVAYAIHNHNLQLARTNIGYCITKPNCKNTDKALSNFLIGTYYNFTSDAFEAQEAERFFLTAIDYDPSFSRAYTDLGLARCTQGRCNIGIRDLRTAVQLDPGSAKAHYNLGIKLWEADLIHDGLSEIQKAVELDPSYGLARAVLGEMYLETNQLDKASDNLEPALRLSGSLFAARLVANLVAREGQSAKAEGIYNLLCEIHSTPLSARKAAILSHPELGDLFTAFDYDHEDEFFFGWATIARQEAYSTGDAERWQGLARHADVCRQAECRWQFCANVDSGGGR